MLVAVWSLASWSRILCPAARQDGGGICASVRVSPSSLTRTGSLPPGRLSGARAGAVQEEGQRARGALHVTRPCAGVPLRACPPRASPLCCKWHASNGGAIGTDAKHVLQREGPLAGGRGQGLAARGDEIGTAVRPARCAAAADGCGEEMQPWSHDAVPRRAQNTTISWQSLSLAWA